MLTSDHVADIIRAHSNSRPRNRQKALGPSSLGTPCQRRLGYQLLDVDKVNTGSDPLAAWIGTAVHAQMEQALADNDDWETEIGIELPGYNIIGTADAFHKPTRTVVDWKVVGETTLKRVRSTGTVGEQYRTQVHLYGLGLDMAGYDVDTVAICMIPRSGRLIGMHLWQERLNHDVAETALRRYEAIDTLTESMGQPLLPMLATADAFCSWCPWWLPAATDITEACPGHQDLPRPAEETTQPNTAKETA
jgi:hypothetical protein